MLCTECGSEMRLTSEPIVEEYKGVSITAKGIEHYVCDACGEYELGPSAADELSRQLVEGYAKARGLLTPSQIREARKKLGMTQTEYEAALGVSTPTASRWENGVMAPSKSVCKLIELLLEGPNQAREETSHASQEYEPEVCTQAIPNGWSIYQGGAAKLLAPRYSTSSGKRHVPTGYDEAKEG